MFVHPETDVGETFFTNAAAERFSSMLWKSKRGGLVSYDGNGTKLTHDDWHPVFIRIEELKERGLTLEEARKSINRH